MDNKKLSPGNIENYLYSLSKTINEHELEKKGFINVSGIQDKEIDKITNFLNDTKINKKSLLKVYNNDNNKLYTKVFYYDSDYKEIQSWTYYPWEQYASSPDKRFKEYDLLEKDNIVTVKLINKKNDFIPVDNQTLIDEILYSYYNN